MSTHGGTTDERLRRRERAAAADPAEGARLLAERLRAGRASPADLRLLAALGHAAAAEVLGQPPPPPVVSDLAARLLVLWDLGLPVGLRALVAAGRFFLEAWEAEAPADDRPREALDAAQAWLDAADAERADRATACALAAEPARRAAAGPTRTLAARLAAELGARACALAWEGDAGPQARARAVAWAGALAEAGLPVAGVWGAIQAALVPWALAREDRPRAYAPAERFARGERLVHARFGPGVVEQVAGRALVVRFDADGLTRRLTTRA